MLFALDAPSRPLPSYPILVGYFPQWGVYNQYFVKNLVTSGAAGLLNQIDYSQGMIKDNRCAIGDPNADLNLVYTAENSIDGRADPPSAPLRGNFRQLQLLRQHYPKLRVLLSIEGNPAYFASAAQPENRAAFVSSCIDMFIRGHFAQGVEGGPLFDGFDLDWEFPSLPTPATIWRWCRSFGGSSMPCTPVSSGALPSLLASAASRASTSRPSPPSSTRST